MKSKACFDTVAVDKGEDENRIEVIYKTKTMKTTIRLFLMFALVGWSCRPPNKSNEGWQMVFQNDANGQAVYGDKSRLIDAVRLGYPVRIGWGGNRVEHVADASFLTIFEGEEVFGQINTIVGQAPSIVNDSLKISFRQGNHWTKIAGTNGYSMGFMTNYLHDTLVVKGTDRYSATRWYVLYPGHQLDMEARPLWRTESPNWEKWKQKEE